jgi:molybdopterin synthase catalytic subunit
MPSGTNVRVQREAFDSGFELNTFMARNPKSGGIASFIGQMRDFRGATRESGEAVAAMTLEHYPGMAERELETLVAEARQRWTLDDAMVIHRHGELKPGDAIVLVATASAHRADALAACEFLIDWLKTKAPFWKKETTPSGATWVEANASDDTRAKKWRGDGA